MLAAKPPKTTASAVPITLSKLLLVEGATPMHFFEAFLQHLGLANAVEIHDFGSLSNLRPSLVVLAGRGEFQGLVTSLGIVCDAESRDVADAQRSISDALTAAGLVPSRTPPIRTSCFILPDNTNKGMIENLCMEAVKNEPTLAGAFACVDAFFTCLTQNAVALPPEPILAKNHAQAYLATRLDVQLFPGLAAYRGHWPFDNPVFDPIKQFLHAL